jgi:HEPN domain-containing protein
MENIVDQPLDCAHGTKRPRAQQALAKRVREALLSLGGEAHRQTVIEQVAREMGHDVLQIPEELEAAVIVSFEAYWRDEARRAAYGFHLRFGEGSHRWAIRPVPAVAR